MQVSTLPAVLIIYSFSLTFNLTCGILHGVDNIRKTMKYKCSKCGRIKYIKAQQLEGVSISYSKRTPNTCCVCCYDEYVSQKCKHGLETYEYCPKCEYKSL